MTSFDVRAQTAGEIAAQVAAALAGGYAVELDNSYRYFPIDLSPNGLRSQIREEWHVLGGRVTGELQEVRSRAVLWPARDPDQSNGGLSNGVAHA